MIPLLIVALGLVDPACTVQDICTPGYTKTVRPPAGYTNNLKRLQMAELGLGSELSRFEEDHIIPLELCGAPRDPGNLIPQLWSKARMKDVIETRYHRAVCAGTMTLEEAQRLVVGYE